MSKKNQILKTLLILTLLPIFILLIKQVQDNRNRAANIPADIIIYTNNIQSNIPKGFWSNFAQGGEESHTNMIKPVQNQLTSLHPQYIRIDHVFDFYTTDELDKVVETILATGAKPFFSLTNPEDISDWESAVTTLVNRYSVAKNIDNIYYEVLNEPDLYNKMHYKNEPNYLNFYGKTAIAVAAGAGNRPYKIGGPATSGYYKNWIMYLLDYCKNNGIKLDFLSWHKYSKDINSYLTDITDLNKMLSEYPKFNDIEKIISEFGPLPGNDDWYNNYFSAIHLLSLSTQLSPYIHKAFSFEIIDGPNSKWGLFKKDTSPKQRLLAYNFLNQLEGKLLSSEGNGSYVSSLGTRNGNKIQILLVNYDPENSHTETVPLTFKDLPKKQYELKITEFTGNTTSQIINNAKTSLYLKPNSAYLLELNL